MSRRRRSRLPAAREGRSFASARPTPRDSLRPAAPIAAEPDGEPEEPEPLPPEERPTEAPPPPAPQIAAVPIGPSIPELPRPKAPSISPDAPITGALLKRAREARGLSQRAIADRTRMTIATVAALEEERFEALPEARIYVRGFVRCFAQEVGLDPERAAHDYLARWERHT